MDLLAAFTLGFLGSLHCIGMCGPLMLAVPGNAQSRWKFILERLLYHFGRSIMYAVMGAVVGLFGTSIFFAGVQQNVSLIVGTTLLLTILIPMGIKAELHKFSPLTKLYTFVKTGFGVLLQKRGNLALFTMGLLNGLLPCGLVYTALIGATAVAQIERSAAFMVLFGIGTMPALIAVSLAGKMISVKFRPLITKAIPFFSLVVAVILILRGMNLGIPLVSPKVQQSHQQNATPVQKEMDCCQ
jgi:uncharacterized protein